jgi:hypothetical protein
MKIKQVRHKRLSDKGDYRWELLHKLGPYFICIPRESGPPVALHQDDYEEVPTETWRDMTGECEIRDLVEIYHNGLRVVWANGYRLRKVQIQNGWRDEIHPRIIDAFIVEKREP